MQVDLERRKCSIIRGNDGLFWLKRWPDQVNNSGQFSRTQVWKNEQGTTEREQGVLLRNRWHSILIDTGILNQRRLEDQLRMKRSGARDGSFFYYSISAPKTRVGHDVTIIHSPCSSDIQFAVNLFL